MHAIEVQREDQRARFASFLAELRDPGIDLLCSADRDGLAAAALLGKALRRIGLPLRSISLPARGDDASSEATRLRIASLRPRALVVIGLGRPRGALYDHLPRLLIDARLAPGGRRRELSCGRWHLARPSHAALVLELVAAVTDRRDLSWLAALEDQSSDEDSSPGSKDAVHRHGAEVLRQVAVLLDAAVRGPSPEAVLPELLSQLLLTPDPGRFLEGPMAAVLLPRVALLRSETARASHARARAAHQVVLFEIDSPCRVEAAVAARWGRLRPGTLVVVANRGAAPGRVALAAACPAADATERLRACLPADERATEDLVVTTACFERVLRALGLSDRAPAPWRTEPASPG